MSKTIIFFVLSIWLLTGCHNGEHTQEAAASSATPEAILLDLNQDNRFISVDEVADKIINQDPSLLLVDVRPHTEFDAFSLEGAINVPLNDFLDEANLALLDCHRYSIVFYANSSISAEQAWMLSRRLGCQDIYIMKGGLTDWAEKIINPSPPPLTAGREALELYNFRKAAGKYFAGTSQQLEPEPFVETAPAPIPRAAKKTIKVEPKKPRKAVEEEGC